MSEAVAVLILILWGIVWFGGLYMMMIRGSRRLMLAFFRSYFSMNRLMLKIIPGGSAAAERALLAEESRVLAEIQADSTPPWWARLFGATMILIGAAAYLYIFVVIF